LEKYTNDADWIEKVVKLIIGTIVDKGEKCKIHPSDQDETSIIMLAWAPWSGKTEFILSVLPILDFFFIDTDSYRDYFIWYNGKNASNYQHSISKVLDWILKYCFKNDIRFILDWTFKSLSHAIRNVDNAKRKKRKIEIFYIFQNPYLSYLYTYLRQVQNERGISTDSYVECFYESIRNVYLIKEKYGNLELFVCEKIVTLPWLFWKKDYKAYHDIETIEKFCIKYDIDYNDWEFIHRDNLKVWIRDFRNFLRFWHLLIKFTSLTKKLLWQIRPKKY
jgi:hypothetical protein